MSYKFYIVDVFAEEKYAGNQLAVFRNANGIITEEMQKIAFEINYSETTFILSDDKNNNGFDVRIFTPKQEIPFAGHPTLGTAFIIQNEIIQDPADKIVLNLQVGNIPVEINRAEKKVRMKQNFPDFGQQLDGEQIVNVLSLNKDDLDDRFPIEDVSTGLPFFIVPLKDLATLKKVKIIRDKYYELVNESRAKGILVFCPEGYDGSLDLSVRVFADYWGSPEDPATGSGNGCLAGYLVKHRYLGSNKIKIQTGQGYEVGRPSKLYLEANEDESGINIYVGGRVIKIAEGFLSS